MTRRLEVEFVTPSCAYVRGYRSRELITDLRGRPPVWAGSSKAWVCQPPTARDLIAAAESRGYRVTITGDTRPETVLTAPAEHADPEQGLW